MEKYIYGKNCIEYQDFINLLKKGGWKLCLQMKDNWDVMRHLEYLSGLNRSKANLTVIYTIDSITLENARTIDVYITSNNQDMDTYSSPKHIKFINDQPTL